MAVRDHRTVPRLPPRSSRTHAAAPGTPAAAAAAPGTREVVGSGSGRVVQCDRAGCAVDGDELAGPEAVGDVAVPTTAGMPYCDRRHK